MYFDDRLATVLNHRAAGARAARVQFRQLLDLLGEPHRDADPGLTRAAFRRLDALLPMIPLEQREQIASECSARIRNPLLLAWFASGEPRVAIAALARASLDDEQWRQLIPDLPIHARGLLRHRRNLPRSAQQLLDQLGVSDRILPEPLLAEPSDLGGSDSRALDLGTFAEEDYVLAPETGKNAGPRTEPPEATDSADLGALVRRIEAFQRAREQRGPAASTQAPRLPLDEDVDVQGSTTLSAFLFTTDDTGRIDWAEPAAAPSVVGMVLIAQGTDADSVFGSDFLLRRPISGRQVELAGGELIAGPWSIDAAPRFAPRSNRFVGYVGRCRRPTGGAVRSAAERAADRVRQLLHELRTPVTAIQGFAEVIQQQTIGPVPHEYRALAAEIAGDAARMLAGFAELERLARLEAGTQELPEGTADFCTVVRRQVAQLQTVLSPRVARIDANWAVTEATVPLAPESAELLAWRFLSTLAAATAAGERMTLTLAAAENTLRLTVQLPAALTPCRDVFSGDIRAVGGALGTSLLGAGFALRLARAEARAAGGDLAREGMARMILTLPLGTARLEPDDTPHRTAVHAER